MENNILQDSKILRRRGTIAPSRNRGNLYHIRNILKTQEVFFRLDIFLFHIIYFHLLILISG